MTSDSKKCIVRRAAACVTLTLGRPHPVAVNRLDRLTSGLMILPLNPALATTLSREFVNGEVKKEYVARCKGKFPEYVSAFSPRILACTS